MLKAIVLALALASCGGPQGSTHSGQTCNFPTVLEQTPNGGDQLLLCGNGDVLECRDGSCALASAGPANSGSPNSGNPNNSNQGNPVDSNNRTVVNPTPTPSRLAGR